MPPRNYRDSISGIKQREVFDAVHGVQTEKGMKLIGMEYTMSICIFSKQKTSLCATGNQHVEGIRYDARDMYAPVLEAAEV